MGLRDRYRRAAIPVAALCLLLPGALGADPRWWWDDAAVTSDGAEKASPDIALVGGEAGGQGGGILLVAWQQQDAPGDDWDIWLTASGDGGCSFCDPVRLTDNDLDDTRPRIAAAALPLPDMPLSIQVVFEQEGNVVLAWDASTVPAVLSGPAFCARLSDLGTIIPGNGQYLQMNPVNGTARRPDIDLSSMFFAFNHFHVAWEDNRDGPWDIWHDRDLTGDTSGYGAPLNLTSLGLPAGDALLPAVSGDTLGLTFGTDGGVSIAFVDAATGEVLYLRSNDSGTQWSGTGAPPALPPVDLPVAISSTGPGPVAGPSLDGSDSDWGAGHLWTAASWARGQGGGAQADVEHRRSPLSIDLPWDRAGEIAAGESTLAVSRTATALEPNLGGRSGAWTFWEGAAGAAGEVMCRAGTLDTAVPSVDFDLFPFAPERPLDTSLSGVRLLTHCAFDESDYACPTTRSVGGAGDMAAASEGSPGAGPPSQHLVWIDTRGGSTEVFHKRTDTWVNSVQARLDTSCETLTEARIAVRIDPPAGCDATWPAPERIRRHFVYYGTDEGGPYANAASPISVTPDPLLPAVLEIGGLSLGTRYWVIVVPEDEARNVVPSDFDPSEDRASWFTETSIDTPAICSPVVAVSACLTGPGSCPRPGHPVDGNIDFGETFEVRLTFENSGSTDALNVRADFEVLDAAINLPAGGAIRLPSIPAGGSVDVALSVTVDEQAGPFRCGDLVDMRVGNLAADNGGPWPDDELAGCDVVVGDGAGSCSACAAGSPNMVLARCEVKDDHCGLRLGGDGNGIPEPGERVEFQMEFFNAGDRTATDFTGDVALAWGGTPVSGFGPLAPVTVPPGGTAVYDLELDAGDHCGDTLDIEVAGLGSDTGLWSWPDVSSACDRVLGSMPTPISYFYSTFQSIVLPDDGAEIAHPETVSTGEAIRVDQALLWVGGSQPGPADIRLRLEGPGGPPGIVADAAWNANIDITPLYNDPVQGGPGDYRLYVRDAAAGGGDGNVWGFQVQVTDSAADCTDCADCVPLDFTGPTLALPEGECSIRVTWPAGSGQGGMTYRLERDGVPIASGLATTTWLDSPVAWGDVYRYRASAADECPSGLPSWNDESADAMPGDPVGALFGGPPAPVYDGSVNGDCSVAVDAGWSADCAPVTLFEILRDGVPVHASASDPFPWTDAVAGDGVYVYTARLTDEAGNVSMSPDAPPLRVDNCNPAVGCLHVLEVSDLEDYQATKPGGWFLVPPGPGDVHLDTPPAACPFASGSRRELTTGVPLTFYDLNRAARDLRVTLDPTAADLVFTFTP